MPTPSTGAPDVSVVIPTYNRSGMLRRTLWSLARQEFPDGVFEVVVADDGSSDDTAAVVRSFSDRLTVSYHHQEDIGFRAAQARNAGARMAAAPVLVFMDTGTLAGPRTLAAHRQVQTEGPSGRAVIGDTYGYRPEEESVPGLAEAIIALPPEEVLERYRDVPAFRDCRRDEFAKAGHDIGRRATPWLVFWTTNVSVRATDFWDVGGFDEGFRGWGVEDLELGFRLFDRGVPFAFSREAWAVETPHDRDVAGHLDSNQRNALRFLLHHPHPAVELTWGMYQRDLIWEIEDEYVGVLAWTRRTRNHSVQAEIERAVAGVPEGTQIAVLGCGGEVPDTLPAGSSVTDYDPELLEKAVGCGRHRGANVIGIRTPFADGSSELVVVTSRLAGMWAQWHREILAEAHRIGRLVDVALPVPPANSTVHSQRK